MRADEERILIYRLAAGELDAVEEEQARALIARQPELAALLDQLNELRARVPAAFPEPPPLGESRAFVQLLQRLAPGAVESDPPPAPRAALRSIAPSLADSRPQYSPAALSRGAVTSTRGLIPRWFGARQRSPEAHLFHLREIQRDDRLSVELEFYAGDVLALHSEVLLVSAFAGSYHPTPGSVFGAIADRYGISFAAGPPPGATRYPEGLLHFPVSTPATPAFDALWVLELREPRQSFSVEDLRAALRAVEERLSEMLAGASSITLPLLGTGHQRLNPRDVARELLSALPRWAEHPRLRTVRVVTLELEHVAALNRALDDRQYSEGNSALAYACHELQRRLEEGDWREPLRAALKDLLAIASAPDASMQSIAFEGRRIAEAVLRAGLLAEEDDAAQRRQVDLAAPHLQLLLAHGRSAAAGEAVGSNDAVMILYAAMRVADTAGVSA